VLSALLSRRLIPLHLLLLLVLAGTGTAGWWQLQAWRYEQADDASRRASLDPVPLGEVLGPDEPFTGADDGRPVLAQGRYASSDQQFLVSGRPEQGQTGYWVLSPLWIDGLEPPSALLVVRGWTAEAASLPPVPGGQVTVTGILKPGEEGSGEPDGDRVIEAVRIPAIVNQLDGDVYSGFLLRTGPPDPGLRPVTPPPTDPRWSAGLRNLAYALQWWLFGGFAVFLWWRICADHRSVASPV